MTGPQAEDGPIGNPALPQSLALAPKQHALSAEARWPRKEEALGHVGVEFAPRVRIIAAIQTHTFSTTAGPPSCLSPRVPC